MSVQALISHLNEYLPRDPEEEASLAQHVSSRKMKRRQYLLAQGEVCKHYSFVVEGCFKMYKVDEAAKQHNIMFAAEGDWVVDIGSFHAETPSELYIEAMEPGEVIQISKSDLIPFYRSSLKINRTFRVIIENQFVELQNRLLQTISTTAEERYEAFMQQYPDLLNRIPSAQIASYLGITPEFLSRIRSKPASRES